MWPFSLVVTAFMLNGQALQMIYWSGYRDLCVVLALYVKCSSSALVCGVLCVGMQCACLAQER